MFHPGDQLVPGYRLEKFLGRGQYGEVWRASSPGGTQCALKILNLSGKQGWKEYRAIQRFKRIRHPHLAPINALWLLDAEGRILDDDLVAGLGVETPGAQATLVPEADPEPQPQPATLIMATALADKTLGDRLRECQAEGHAGIPRDELLRYMEEAAKGLDFLNTVQHDLGTGQGSVQHCDIKPENILLSGGSALICDFGVSQVLGGGQTSATATSMVGSPAYMSPECVERRPSSASDQYSLALTYFELRTGGLPFEDLNCLSILQAHRSGGLKLDALPPAERVVIQRAISLRPEDRFATSAEMASALRAATEQPPARSPRRGRAIAGGGLAVAAAGLLVWAVLGGRGEAPPLPPVGTPAQAEADTELPPPPLPDGRPGERAQNVERSRSAEAHARAGLALIRGGDLDADRLAAAVAEYRQALTADPLGRYAVAPPPEHVLRPPAGGPATALRAMQLTHDLRQVVAAGDSGAVWAWRLDDPGAPAQKLAQHDGAVWSLARAPGRIASADLSGQIQVTRLTESGSAAGTLAVPSPGGMAEVAISPDGRWLAAGGEDGSVLLWDLEAADPDRTRRELGSHAEAVTAVEFLDPRWLVTASFDDTIRRWPVPPETGEAVQLARQAGDVNCLAIAGSVGAIAFAGEGGPANAEPGGRPEEHRVSLHRPADDSPQALPLGHGDVIEALAWNDSGDRLASGAVDGTIQVWSLGEASLAGPAFLHGHTGPVRGLAFCPLPGWLVSGGADKSAALWRWESDGPTPTAMRLAGHQGRVLAVAVTPQWIITACEDGAVRLWHLGQCLLIKQACDEAGVPPRSTADPPSINVRRPSSVPPPRVARAGSGRTGFRLAFRPSGDSAE